jgi:ribose 5-phosphate isomerase B
LGISDASQNDASASINERTLAEAKPGAAIAVPRGAIVTPLAREVARERGVTLLEHATHPTTRSAARSIAIGADHGGVALKDALKAYLEEMGYTVVDCGTFSTEAVDYPDFALAVAEWVANGRAWRGIVVDGAGIGSCMAANKVPGVRAALCYDQASAHNSREHNDANVLTLGAGLIGAQLAKQIVKTWIETDFAGGRHARRVDKISAIEKRFARK